MVPDRAFFVGGVIAVVSLVPCYHTGLIPVSGLVGGRYLLHMIDIY